MVRITRIGTSTMIDIMPLRQRGASFAGKKTIDH
jgi:hypothetical protein